MATYLITQATGQQSKNIIKHLLQAGNVNIHALVRDIQKVPSELHHSSIKLFQGESKNIDDVYKAAQGCKAVFLNTVPIPGLEPVQAKSAVEACEKAGVESIVVSTSLCTEKREYWDDEHTKKVGLHGYWSSKAELEDTVRRGKFKSYTILRPGVIHFDFFLPGSQGNWPRLSTHCEIDQLMNDDARFGLTDNDDIAKYATAALQNPEKFKGQEISLVSEALTMEEVVAIVSKVSGREVRAVKRTSEELEKLGARVFAQNFQLWFDGKDMRPLAKAAPEIQAKFGIPLTSLEAALTRDKDRLLAGLPAQ